MGKIVHIVAVTQHNKTLYNGYWKQIKNPAFSVDSIEQIEDALESITYSGILQIKVLMEKTTLVLLLKKPNISRIFLE